MSSSTNNADSTGSSNKYSSDGRKKHKSSDASSSPPSAATNITGFHTAMVYLRSILIHPIGLTLASLLNEAPLPKFLYDHWVSLSDVKELLSEYNSKCCTYRDDIFSSTMSKWKSKREVDLTKSIFTNIKNRITDDTLDGYTKSNAALLTIENESPVGGGKRIIVDLIISKKCSNEIQTESKPKQSVVMIVEFGVHHTKWWQKLGQILAYVEILRTENESKYIVDQPMLLTVVTVSSDTTETSNNTIVARYGIFLYIPKAKGQYRLALLWRVDSFDIDNASKQFGKTLYAAQCCANLRDYFTSTIMKPDFETSYQYLGPNCCRIGQIVST